MDSRVNSDGTSIRRRRKCPKCEERFTTYEYVEEVPLMVVKRDGRRQAFDRTRVLNGLIKACEKRPIGVEQIECVVDDIEHTIRKKYDREIHSKDIGEMVMTRLSTLDEVAYVRFASVYKGFEQADDFAREIGMLVKSTAPKHKA